MPLSTSPTPQRFVEFVVSYFSRGFLIETNILVYSIKAYVPPIWSSTVNIGLADIKLDYGRNQYVADRSEAGKHVNWMSTSE